MLAKVSSVMFVLFVLGFAVVPAMAQIPTPAAELWDGETAIGLAWPLVLIFLALLAPIFAIVFSKSLTKWVGGLITRFARK